MWINSFDCSIPQSESLKYIDMPLALENWRISNCFWFFVLGYLFKLQIIENRNQLNAIVNLLQINSILFAFIRSLHTALFVSHLLFPLSGLLRYSWVSPTLYLYLYLSLSLSLLRKITFLCMFLTISTSHYHSSYIHWTWHICVCIIVVVEFFFWENFWMLCHSKCVCGFD